MAYAVGGLVLPSDGEYPFAEALDFFADLFKAFLGEAAGDAGYATVVAGEAVVDFAVDFQILQVVFPQDGGPYPRRCRDNGVRNLVFALFAYGDEPCACKIVYATLYLGGAESGGEHSANFFGRCACWNQRQEVSQYGVVPLGKKLEGGILQGVFCVGASGGEFV